MESALTELRWSTFESWVWLNRDRIFETPFRVKAEPKEESSKAGQQEEDSEAEQEDESSATEGAASPSDDDKQERATRLPRPLPEDYHDLCPRFLLPEAEGAALDFELPEMVQAAFYAMLLNDAIELGVVRDFIADDLKSTLVGLRWTCFEAWMSRTSHKLREAQLRQRPVGVEAHGSLDVFAPYFRSELQVAGATWRGRSGWLLPRGMHSPGGRLPLFIKEGEIPIAFHSFLSWTKREKSRGARERREMNLFLNFANIE
ncbi:hypothetical protein Cgig2_006349 [Carnegiea gigantea]|uniref:Uncharacterized protein n=1 Tax=Carnegiea gigantea TaxID=171969 RepID=A0A9Q1JPL4_9CARY|nr:hypothetical protein Cgig2_006349 [Carnegiea gigantea]